jgi:hypothetical protein
LAKTVPVSPKASSIKKLFANSTLILKNAEIQKQKLKKIYELEKKAQDFIEPEVHLT